MTMDSVEGMMCWKMQLRPVDQPLWHAQRVDGCAACAYVPVWQRGPENGPI